MTVKVEHDIRSADGGCIYMPPYIGGEEGWGNLEIPDVHVASAIQKYPRGTIFRKGEKSWVYTKLKTTTNPDAYGGYTGGRGLFSVAQDSASLTVSVATLGENTVTVTDDLTVNAYAGGLLTMYLAGQPIVSMGIISNTAHVITLDGNLPGSYVASTCQVIASPYHEVVMAGASCNADGVYDYCPGIFNSPLDGDGNVAAEDDFVWLQCAGLCFAWASGSYEGEIGGERTAVMMGDGACQIIAANDYRHNRQVVGYLFPGTGDVTTVGNNPSDVDGTDVDFMNHIIFLTIRH